MDEKRLSTVYHLVSTRSDKIRVGSLWGTDLAQRLAKYRYVSRHSDDAVSRWVREVGVDSLRIIPMVVKVCTLDEVRMLEQEHINTYGCELNPLSAYLSADERDEYYCKCGQGYRERNGEKLKVYFAEHRRKNAERIRKRVSERVSCGCGSVVRRGDFARHIKTDKHLKWVLDVD